MVYYLYLILIAFFPLGVIARITIFPTITVSAFDIISILIIIGSFKKIRWYLSHPRLFEKLFIGLIIIGMLGVVINSSNFFDFFASIAYLIRIVAYVLLVIPILYFTKKQIKTVKLELLISGIAFILFGYIQYLYYPNLRNLFYLGWDEHLYRLFSTTFDPNFAGAFIVLVLVYFSYFFFEYYKNAKPENKILLFSTYVFILPSVFLTYSRSAFIVFIITFLLFFFLTRKFKILALLLIVFGLGIFILPKQLGGEGVNLIRTASIFQRFETYKSAGMLIRKNPITGVGFSSIRSEMLKHNLISTENKFSHAASGFPNSYLYILVTTGFVGITFFLVGVCLILNKLWNDALFKKRYLFEVCVFSSFVGVLIGSLLENLLFFPMISVWIIILFGMYFNKDKFKK